MRVVIDLYHLFTIFFVLSLDFILFKRVKCRERLIKGERGK